MSEAVATKKKINWAEEAWQLFLLALAANFAITPEGAATLVDRAREMRDLARAPRH